MPSDHRVGLDNNKAGTPVWPEPKKPRPQDPIRLPQAWTLGRTLEYGELVMQGNIFKEKSRAGEQQGPEKCDE